jgi:hypothetical protein
VIAPAAQSLLFCICKTEVALRARYKHRSNQEVTSLSSSCVLIIVTTVEVNCALHNVLAAELALQTHLVRRQHVIIAAAVPGALCQH